MKTALLLHLAPPQLGPVHKLKETAKRKRRVQVVYCFFPLRSSETFIPARHSSASCHHGGSCA